MEFYVDSGAGQCMCSCVDAFLDIRSCAVIVVGVAGSIPIHGVGTACFLVADSMGSERILRIHNCLLCEHTESEENFNLISVSQVLRTNRSSIVFNSAASLFAIKQGKRQQLYTFALRPDDGLYALKVLPLNATDVRHDKLVSIDLTDDDKLDVGDFRMELASVSERASTRPASKLGVWYTKVLWIGKVFSLAGRTQEFEEKLTEFCANYHAPL